VDLGQPIDKFKDIESAVGWLNTSIVPYRMYIDHIKTNGLEYYMKSQIPSDFEGMSDDELTNLSHTIQGQNLRAEILDILYPHETPMPQESEFALTFYKPAFAIGTLLVDTNGNVVKTYNSVSIQRNQWTHVVEVVDRNSKNAYIYTNGTLQAAIDISSLTDPIVPKGGEASGWPSFNGSLNDVRVYNRALLPSDVAQLYMPVYQNQSD